MFLGSYYLYKRLCIFILLYSSYGLALPSSLSLFIHRVVLSLVHFHLTDFQGEGYLKGKITP